MKPMYSISKDSLYCHGFYMQGMNERTKGESVNMSRIEYYSTHSQTYNSIINTCGIQDTQKNINLNENNMEFFILDITNFICRFMSKKFKLTK